MSQLAAFEALLRRAAELGAPVRLVPSINAHYGDVEFYAHIENHDSDTVDMSIDNGPRLALIELQRSAPGLTGDAALDISRKAASFTRQPLDD
jgi:hypothetical protein